MTDRKPLDAETRRRQALERMTMDYPVKLDRQPDDPPVAPESPAE